MKVINQIKTAKKVHLLWLAVVAVALFSAVLTLLVTERASGKVNIDKVESHPFHQPYTLMVSSDFHYQRNIGDNHTMVMGQMLYNHEIVDAFFSTVAEKAPDALLLCGDNTHAGYEEDHADLIESLTVLKQQGTDVVMAFGSHDLVNSTKDEIKAQYADLIFADAVSVDATTLSYIYPVSAELWILVLDPFIEIDHLHLSSETLEWMISSLEHARENHIQVIAMSHYGVTPSQINNNEPYSEIIEKYAVIDNNDRLLELFEIYNISLYLSGHRHKQLLKKQQMPTGTIYELISNTLMNYPNIYGEIDIITEKDLSYHASYLDVSGYAKAHHLNNPDLLSFSTFSRKSFLDQANKSIAGTTENLNLSGDDRAEMEDFAVRVLFSFAVNEFHEQQSKFKREPAFRLWKNQYLAYGYGFYLEHLLTTAAYDNNNFSFHLN
ncbi:Predicted phosphohydrolase, MPP superfamily [Desulfuromusa kysingii]|uniref:Predicted phosphohydrolase, MPP superfamily n=1 Tax=Desulfuromusa kysingii TaxID=37625 RepID=A0A1H4DGN1_9BACT|nr:metallophosphoesterase [Desulfuromusa kysingii]SEA71402.1 Predicted phosphohydrolase, MPP superfamily [Desulfuromusa kysingii]